MNGNYSFKDLPPGLYRVRELQQVGYTQTTADPADITGVGGVDVPNVDFGNFKLFSITVTKFNDINKNGMREVGEPGVPGITIFLDTNPTNGVLDMGETSHVTDMNGQVVFTDLGPGTYFLAEILPSGYIQTLGPLPIVGMSGKDVSDAVFGNKALPKMLVAPPNLALLGVAVVGVRVGEKAFVVTNQGPGDLKVFVPGISKDTKGMLLPDFYLITGPGGAPIGPAGITVTIPPKSARPFWVRFKPLRTGFRSAFFRVSGVFPFEDPTLPFYDVNVNGTGL
jgi:hypothetical protein